MATQIESGEANVTNSKLLGCCGVLVQSPLYSFEKESYWGEEWAGEWQHGRSISIVSLYLLRDPPPLSSNPVE